jgi:hypothetical protein
MFLTPTVALVNPKICAISAHFLLSGLIIYLDDIATDNSSTQEHFKK